MFVAEADECYNNPGKKRSTPTTSPFTSSPKKRKIQHVTPKPLSSKGKPAKRTRKVVQNIENCKHAHEMIQKYGMKQTNQIPNAILTTITVNNKLSTLPTCVECKNVRFKEQRYHTDHWRRKHFVFCCKKCEVVQHTCPHKVCFCQKQLTPYV